MAVLSSRVSISSAPVLTQEDIFATGLAHLFTDDTQNCHGNPGEGVIYHSPIYGDIKLAIPQHPDVEEGRKLFAHFLWNAGILAADAIERASRDEERDSADTEDRKVSWDTKYWDMRGKDVLELGSATALPSIIAALAGANSVTISDHPSSPAITNDTISQNVQDNLKTRKNPTETTIAGLSWGDRFFTSPSRYGKLADPQPAPQSFDRIIIADCLWMPSQHLNLVKTIHQWLRKDNTNNDTGYRMSESDSSVPCALVIAGFHTGRSTVASFFETATAGHITLAESDSTTGHDTKQDEAATMPSLSVAQIFEVDVNFNVRDWVIERLGEDKHTAKWWCVCAVLVRKGD